MMLSFENKKCTADDECSILGKKEVLNNDIDKMWFSLAESRAKQLESGAVQSVSWEQLKKAIIE